MKKKILIIGATSGIGFELARQYCQSGCIVGGVGRNKEKLKELQKYYPSNFRWQQFDIRSIEDIPYSLSELIKQTGGMDICIMSASISEKNPDLEWQKEADVIGTNINGYARVLIFAATYFKEQGYGHIVGISSIAKAFGFPNPAYNASKAFESIYLRGLRLNLESKGVTVTEILPGFVQTPLIEENKSMFWIVPVEKAANQIIRSIEKKKHTAYISRRWKFVSAVIAHIPYPLLRFILKKAGVLRLEE